MLLEELTKHPHMCININQFIAQSLRHTVAISLCNVIEIQQLFLTIYEERDIIYIAPSDVGLQNTIS